MQDKTCFIFNQFKLQLIFALYIHNVVSLHKEKLETMKTKHTPGPWRVKKVNDIRYITRTNENIAGNICQVTYPHAFPMPCIKQVDELKANANLIAAAPGLLEAMQSFINYYDNGKIRISILEEAIKKATV